MFFMAKPDETIYASPSCEELYARYGKILFRVCYAILCSKEDAEDAVQETFYKYLIKTPTFRDEAHEQAWFLRVASNQSKDMLRRRKIRSTLSLEEIEEFEVAPEQATVLQDLFSLPEKYKTVLILHYLEDISIQDIARVENLSVSAVKMRLVRGREMLKNITEGKEN
ncbi:MAG: RNA polymerase sigma factor [Clostridia bacterium]|nr:RNA polymerase sigma factor [Clostridia bacterium]